VDGAHIVAEARRDSAQSGRRPGLWRLLIETVYVLCVTAVAVWGFYTDTTATILLAVLVSLPMGGPALVGYYMAYGVLAGVSGANPDTVRSHGRCTPSGGCESFTTGETPEWFLHTMDIIGVVAFVAAAVLNVVLLRMLNTTWRNRKESPGHVPW